MLEYATWGNVCGTEMLKILEMIITMTIFKITLAEISICPKTKLWK